MADKAKKKDDAKKIFKITNKCPGPRGAYLDGKLVMALPNETIEADDFSQLWFVEGESVDGEIVDDGLMDKIRDAIAELDADDDEHWTARGQPDATVVSEKVGKVVTRKDINLAAPGEKRPDPEPE